MEEKRRKGAFYTPIPLVSLAYSYLDKILGNDWQQEYLVWDMCCGVGNLQSKHSNHSNIFMSTLDQADIDIMKSNKVFPVAYRFQYDYLNDDITQSGEIDYTLTNKMPKALQQAIATGKKILVLINPPYAEATNAKNTSLGAEAANKTGVAKTTVAAYMMNDYGKASNELFGQFIARIAQEVPQATLAMFSTLKYIVAPSFEKLRGVWNAQYEGGFVIHSQAFDGLVGNFPIAFAVWKTNNTQDAARTPITQVAFDVLDKKTTPIGQKIFVNIPNSQMLNTWIKRPRANSVEVIPLKNAISPATTQARVKTWSEGALGYMCCAGNDVQQTVQLTALYSSLSVNGHGFYVTPENLTKAAVTFSVRRLIRPTWLNDRDQFCKPHKELSLEFENDCLIWILFNGNNLSASADNLEWGGKRWSIVNHFIPFTEGEVDARERFESDFMVQFMQGKIFSPESLTVLQEGKKLWRQYFSMHDDYKTRELYKLGRADVGWYQVRKALEERTKNAVNFTNFKAAYVELTAKLVPQVYEYGFMQKRC